MRKKTKKDMVLDHLINEGSITSWEAIQKYKATRLSAIIYNLRQEGYVIEAIPNNGADGVRYAKYVLVGGE